ncbi:MAG: hypothetical protein IPJ17_05860 [Holophagales bacterium]|nr:MAG: hypothetical protein IPJ17_05860 [Holophagales bacterium]
MPPIAKPLRHFLILAVALLPLACDRLLQIGNDPREHAKKRVEFILAARYAPGAGKASDFQTAVCRWYGDKIIYMDRDTLERALDGYENFTRSQGFAEASITQLSIDEVRDGMPGDPPGTYLVRATINHKTYWLGVPPDAEITWR